MRTFTLITVCRSILSVSPVSYHVKHKKLSFQLTCVTNSVNFSTISIILSQSIYKKVCVLLRCLTFSKQLSPAHWINLWRQSVYTSPIFRFIATLCSVLHSLIYNWYIHFIFRRFVQFPQIFLSVIFTFYIIKLAFLSTRVAYKHPWILPYSSW